MLKYALAATPVLAAGATVATTVAAPRASAEGLRLHNAAGGPDLAPIFFSVDGDIGSDTWDSTAVQWFRGINAVLGVQRTGIYGGARQCRWAIADDVIGHSTVSRSRPTPLTGSGLGRVPA